MLNAVDNEVSLDMKGEDAEYEASAVSPVADIRSPDVVVSSVDGRIVVS